MTIFSGWIEKIRGPKRNKTEEKRQAHEDRYGPEGFGDFIRESGCVVARQSGSQSGCLGPIQHCHNQTRSHGWRNNSFGCCLGHHAEQHAKGIKSFQKLHDLDLDLECCALSATYDRITHHGW